MSQVVYLTVDQDHHHHHHHQQAPQPNTPGVAELPKSQTQPNQIHPHLLETTDPIKGRQFRTSYLITKDTTLLIDRPYAILPVVDNPANNDSLICSNPICNRPSPCHNGDRCPCPNACVPDVVWCSVSCRKDDEARHAFECTWLKRFASSIRSKWGEYTFGMLWLIVRLLATRHTEVSLHQNNHQEQDQDQEQPKRWDAIDALCGSTHTWPHEQVRNWTVLVKKYLQNSPILPHGLNTERILHLICQEEANSFGLYPRETGIRPVRDPPVDRGEQFGAAVYPTAAIANHSCLPNISHKPDPQGRMVFTASRDILPGEECCIAYFDLTRFTDVNTRREHLRRSFGFLCRCERCCAEETAEGSVEWMEMPVMMGDFE